MLSLFLEGLTQTEIAKKLKVTGPAIWHRTQKYGEIFEIKLFTTGKNGKEKRLSKEGKKIAKIIKKALITLLYGDERIEVNIKDFV